jgi:hypothetical protein
MGGFMPPILICMYRYIIDGINVNTEKLLDWARDSKSEFKPHFVQSHWGGLSILSGDGTVYDGWKSGPDFRTYTKPTPIYRDAAKELIESIQEKGISLYRVRLLIIPANGIESWNTLTHAWRVIVPIQSGHAIGVAYRRPKVNRTHGLETGKAYFFAQNVEHRMYNSDTVDFIGIIAETPNAPVVVE